MIAKKIYRLLKWYFISLVSLGRATKLIYLNPNEIKYGQLPESQFSPKNTYTFVQSGDWDKAVMPVIDHLLYRSYVEHFSNDIPWNETSFYNMAMEKIKKGEKFRGEYGDVHQLDARFEKCDRLYQQIKEFGYKSNKELYRDKQIKNILCQLDEITVNISRTGEVLLNDGWHRFVSARLLGLSAIPVRVLMRHKSAKGINQSS